MFLILIFNLFLKSHTFTHPHIHTFMHSHNYTPHIHTFSHSHIHNCHKRNREIKHINQTVPKQSDPFRGQKIGDRRLHRFSQLPSMNICTLQRVDCHRIKGNIGGRPSLAARPKIVSTASCQAARHSTHQPLHKRMLLPLHRDGVRGQ